jgi:TRAP-type C4-dicarboxylate transport system permease small subunit
MNIYSFREKLDRWVIRSAVFFFTVGVFITFIGVVFRFFPSFPSLSWTDELTRLCMIYSSFIVAGIGLRRGTQIAFTLVLEKVPKPLFRIMTIINSLLMICFISVIGYYGFRLALINKDQLSAVIQIPMVYPYLIIPLSAFLMILENVIRLMEAVSGKLVQQKNNSDIAMQ